MKFTLKQSMITFSLALVLTACSNNEEPVNADAVESLDTEETWEPTEIKLDDNEFLVAKHTSDDGEISMNFLELKNGGVLVALQFDSDTNEEKVKPYNTMLNKMYEGEITLHELYLHFSESSANEESVIKLKLAQVKVEQQKKMGAIPISTEKAEYMRDQSIAYINEKYGNQIDKNNNTSEQLRCDSVPEADLFASQYCNDHSPVHLDMPAEARLTHCLSRSWPGYSLDPSNYVTYYRVYMKNPFISGNNPVHCLISLNGAPIVFSLLPTQGVILHWYTPPIYAYSYMVNYHPECPAVSHAVYEITNL